MALHDQHLHSIHSFDCKTDPRANVEAAIARGLAALTFTEHFDTHPDEWDGCVYDDESYSATIARLRDEFGQRIFIGKGIEVCFQPPRMDFILDFLARHSFDVVLLSVHWSGGAPAHTRRAWEGCTVEEGTRRYLEDVLAAARFVDELHRKQGPVFQVLSHMDFAKRYSLRYLGRYDVTPHMDLFAEILQACLRAGLVPEINTSSLRQGLAETMPNGDVVRLYAQLGGTAMSVGSDAHRAEDIGAGFDVAVDMLRAAGIERTLSYRSREGIPIPIECRPE